VRIRRRGLPLLAGLALAAGVARADSPELARGAALVGAFRAELQETLRQELERDAVEAIAVCRERAPEIAAARSRDGVRLGRTSHRLRNPANAAPEWVRPLLAAYLASPADRAPRAVPLPGDRWGYVEPIAVQAPCLTCHGEVLAPALAARIAELYPEDRAVGFRLDDLRGVFWVEFPAVVE
jgi:hypothetical protein